MQPADPASLDGPSRSSIPFWALGLVLAVALVLRLPGYQESVWIDELYTSRIYTGQTIVLLKTLYSDIHPPAYFLFIHFWNRLFGDGEIMLRLPALLAGLVSIALCARLVATRLGSGAGLTAAGLLAMSPVHIWYSQEARPYSAGVCLVLAALVCRDAWIARPAATLPGIGFALALLGAVFLHYYLAVFGVLFAALALIGKRGPWRRLFAICAAIGLLLAGYMAAKLHFSEVPTSKGYLRGFDGPEAWKLFFEWFMTGRALSPVERPPLGGGWPLLVLQALAVPIFLRGAWRLVAHGGGILLLAMGALPAFLCVLNLAGLDQTYIERSALPSLPLFACTLAAGLTGWRQPRVQAISIGVAGAAAALVLTAYFQRGDAWTVYKANPDWRSAASWVGAKVDAGWEGDMDSDYISPTGLSYYDPRLQEEKYFERNHEKIEALFRQFAVVFGTKGFPGEWIQAFLGRQIEEFEAYLEGLESGTSVRIHELAVKGDRDPGPGTRRFLLVHRSPSPRARRILENPAVTIVDQASFRLLDLYELEWASSGSAGLRTSGHQPPIR